MIARRWSGRRCSAAATLGLVCSLAAWTACISSPGRRPATAPGAQSRSAPEQPAARPRAERSKESSPASATQQARTSTLTIEVQRDLAILDVSILDDALAEEHHRRHQFEGDTKLRIGGLRPGHKYVVASFRPHPARFYPIDLAADQTLRLEPPKDGALRVEGHVLDAAGGPIEGVVVTATVRADPFPAALARLGQVVRGSLSAAFGLPVRGDGTPDPVRGRVHAHGGVVWTHHSDGRYVARQKSDGHGCFELELPRSLWKRCLVRLTHAGQTFERLLDPGKKDNLVRLPFNAPVTPEAELVTYQRALEMARKLFRGIEKPGGRRALWTWLTALAHGAGSPVLERRIKRLRAQAMELLARYQALPSSALNQRARIRGELAALLAIATIHLNPQVKLRMASSK